MKTDLSNIDLSSLPRTCEMVIPEDYIDLMGHMNVMWYTHLFSSSMIGLLGKIGLTSEFIENRGIGIFALESHIRYLAEVRRGERIAIYSRAIQRTEKRFLVMHFMRNESRNQLASTFETLGASVDMHARKMTTIPPEVAEKFDSFLHQHQTLPWPAPLCGVMHA